MVELPAGLDLSQDQDVTFGVGNVLYYPWLQGYWPSAFGFSWKYLDVDVAMRAAKGNGASK